MNRAFRALLDEADKLDLPKSYMGDLEWDRLACEAAKPGDVFVWVLRELGTHIIAPDFVDGVGLTGAGMALSIAKIFPQPQHWYWWNGRWLRKLSGPKEAHDLLRERQSPDLLKRWRQSGRKPSWQWVE